MPLQEALSLAKKEKKDVVEVAPRAKPPVCKLIDFKKFKFLEDKKQKKEKKAAKRVEIKEIKLTPFIAENDLRYRLERAEEFFADGDRVKFSVFFKGRQMAKKQFGYDLLKRVVEELGPISRVEVEPKFVGRRLEMMLSPIKGGVPAEENKDTKKSDKKN